MKNMIYSLFAEMKCFCRNASGVLIACSVALLPAAAETNWYFVGASNDWWNAASYSTSTTANGNTVMPGGTDRIVTRKGQKLYMDDDTDLEAVQIFLQHVVQLAKAATRVFPAYHPQGNLIHNPRQQYCLHTQRQ